MKLILKEKQVYDKINTIKDLLNYIQFNYNIDITFDKYGVLVYDLRKDCKSNDNEKRNKRHK